MSIKPPPVPFEAGADLERMIGSATAHLKHLQGRGGAEAMRDLQKMSMIERALRDLAHGKAFGEESANREGEKLFPSYRSFPDVREGGSMNLLVHDLAVVWNGETWEGDGACSFNKFEDGRYDDSGKLIVSYGCPWPKRLTIMHSSWSPWGIVGERSAESRTHLAPVQNMRLRGMKPGDYLVGEMYLEIC